MEKPRIREVAETDKPWINQALNAYWSSPDIVSKGKITHADQIPGFIADYAGEPAGLITYITQGPECEIITLSSLKERLGIGSGLLNAVLDTARKAGLKRVWLITTNDNVDALKFYQKRGFRIVAFYPDAIKQSRKLKPSIPATGLHTIPIRDEIELEMTI